MKNIICIISGPTATGKTSTSIKLAKKFGGQVVNFDSLVLYNELNIGTAKPSIEEQDGIVHHLVGSQSIKSPLNAADYQRLALPIIKNLHNNDNIVYLVGGSGFYLQTLTKGMYGGSRSSKEILDKSDLIYKEEGIAPFLKFLEKNDQESFERYHQNDHYRIRRAVEFFWSNKTPFSKQRELMPNKTLMSPAKQNKWNIFHCYLDLSKTKHYEIIQTRSQQMIQDGLVKEVQDIIDKGFSKDLKPLQSIGYKETIQYIEGQFETKDDYCERVSISTRQLAKAQRTWFNKVEEKRNYSPFDFDRICHDFQHFLESL